MVFTFVSPDGRVFDVSEDRDQLFDFAHEHGLISQRNNLSNVYKLVDASSGSKQLNYYQPLHKLKWLKQIDKTTKQDLPRAPEPLLGGTSEFFVGSVVPMIPGMNIYNHTTLQRLLNGKYAQGHIDGWAVAELSLDEARAQLHARLRRQVMAK